MSLQPHAGLRALGLALLSLTACADDRVASPPRATALVQHAPADGREIFRHETWGDEVFWTNALHLNDVVQSAVDPATALAVGLKVDAERLPPGLLARADLTNPATTVELLRRDAVVGLRAKVTARGRIAELGITCALCHSTVDNSALPGVGRRLDGWPNRDLNVGAIVALSPVLDAATKAVFRSWGPGRYDAYFNHDGKNAAVLIPPAYGLRDVALETYTGEGPISYWNSYVAVTQMHGQGSFRDPRLGIEVVARPDLVTPKLPVLRDYQFTLEPPAPPAGGTSSTARGAARAATSRPPTPMPRCSTALRRPGPTRCSRDAERPVATGRHRCAARGSTRPTSTTAARRPWPTS